jgi:ribonuclease R
VGRRRRRGRSVNAGRCHGTVKKGTVETPVRDRVLELFERQPASRFTLREIRSRLGNPGGAAEAVEGLVAEGILGITGRNRFALAEELGIAKGRIRMRPSGRGLVVTEGRRIEIAPRDVGAALDGDLVLVRRVEQTGVSTFRGRILSVVERYRKGISGVCRRAGTGWVLDPLDPALPRGIPLEAGRGAREGTVVWGELRGREIALVLSETLGDSSSTGVLIGAIARDFGISGTYPEEARGEAASAASRPVSPAGREDLRGILCFTIDPVDARDFDDAVSISSDDSGFELGVHIADVAAYVEQGGSLDIEAYARSTSVYLPDRVIPMLPEELSNGSCSLRPGEDRLTRTVFIRFDSSGRRTGFRIAPSVIRSRSRLTYEEAFASMQGEPLACPGISEALASMTRLSRLLDRAREARGALDFGSMEFRVGFDSSGNPSSFDPVPDDESHRLIENFMIEANRAVAEHCGWLGLPVLYRVHGEPDREAMTRLRDDLAKLSLTLPAKPVSPSDLRRLLESAKESPAFPLVREAVLRSMMKAVYGVGDTGHFGLALRNYLHFTSPIRRYPDLIVSRALQSVEAGRQPFLADPAAAAESCSAAERRAESAERDCIELLALIYLQGRAGSIFKGVVSGAEDFGVFVRLLDVPAEGLMPVRYLGAGGSQGYRPGSGVEVEVIDSDPALRHLTLRPAGSGGRPGYVRKAR